MGKTRTPPKSSTRSCASRRKVGIAREELALIGDALPCCALWRSAHADHGPRWASGLPLAGAVALSVRRDEWAGPTDC